MSETVIGIIIGGVLTLLGSVLPSLIGNIYEDRKLARQIKIDNNKYIREQKIKAYSVALETLLTLRRYFDISKDVFLLAPQKYREEVKEMNIKFLKASVDIRLYSNDKIANMYVELAKYSKFALSDERLFENSKEDYVRFCDLLAKEMREDLNKLL